LNAVGGQWSVVYLQLLGLGDPRETLFLWQRISILIQRFNAILIGVTFSYPDKAPYL